MHPVLRLSEDFLTDRGVLSLPALPRMLYVVRGSAMVGTRSLATGRGLVQRGRRHGAGERIGRDAVALGLSIGAPAPGATVRA